MFLTGPKCLVMANPESDDWSIIRGKADSIKGGKIWLSIRRAGNCLPLCQINTAEAAVSPATRHLPVRYASVSILRNLSREQHRFDRKALHYFIRCLPCQRFIRVRSGMYLE